MADDGEDDGGDDDRNGDGSFAAGEAGEAADAEHDDAEDDDAEGAVAPAALAVEPVQVETEERVDTVGGDELEEAARRRAQLLRRYKIQEVIKRRQVLLVQVTKEERGNKGAALTTYQIGRAPCRERVCQYV